MKEQARTICRDGGGFWKVLHQLEKLGVPSSRARRMARCAVQGWFLWNGVKERLEA